MFGKEKKEKKTTPDADDEGVIKPEITGKKKTTKKEETPQIPKELQATMDEFKEKYLGMFGQADFNIPGVQQLNLQFAIFAELRNIRGILERIEAQGET